MSDAARELPYFARVRPEPGRRAAWVLAIAVHALLAVLLIYGIRWQTSPPETVSVELVRSFPTPEQAQPAVRERVEKVEEQEPPPPPKAQILRKEPEKPKTIKEKATQSFDAIAKFMQRETERMTKSRIADVVEREQAQLRATQAASARNLGLADYLSSVRNKIRGNIVLPPVISGNPESVFVVTQLPSGEVLSVRLKTSSGNAALDAAVERAILKSSPLPKPGDSSLFERELEIKYRPLED